MAKNKQTLAVVKHLADRKKKTEEAGRVESGDKETNPDVGLTYLWRFESKTRLLCLNDEFWAAGSNNRLPLFTECLLCDGHNSSSLYVLNIYTIQSFL